ncbi:MAG: hypothetical protein AAF495_24970 [Pseudomonadota bacterium]
MIAITGTPGLVEGGGIFQTVDNVTINVVDGGAADTFTVAFGREAGVGPFAGPQEQILVDSLSIDLIETLHIHSVGDNVTGDPTSLGGTAANQIDDIFFGATETIVVDGSNDFSIDNAIALVDAPVLGVVDASALEGRLNIDFKGTTFDLDLTIDGGSNADGDDIKGGNGNDTIRGNDGDDLIDAESGLDVTMGGDGNDDVRGGEDNDDLFGDAGDDILEGDQGSDELDGGSGLNYFLYRGGVTGFFDGMPTPDVAPGFDAGGDDVFLFNVADFDGFHSGACDVFGVITAATAGTIGNVQTVTATFTRADFLAGNFNPAILRGGFTITATAPNNTGSVFSSFLFNSVTVQAHLPGTTVTPVTSSFLAFAVNAQGTKLYVGIAKDSDANGFLDSVSVFQVATATPLGSIDIPVDVALIV